MKYFGLSKDLALQRFVREGGTGQIAPPQSTASRIAGGLKGRRGDHRKVLLPDFADI